MASALGLYEVSYEGVKASNHLAFSRAQEADTAQSAAVYEDASDLSENILKVTPTSVFMADYDSANKLFSLKYAQGSIKTLSADNDNKVTPGLAQAFNKSNLWASNAFNPVAMFGGVASVARTPKMAGPALIAA